MIKPSQFLETLVKSRGFARPNLFNLEIFPPEGLQVSSTTLEQLCNNVLTTELPGRVIDAQQNVSGGYIPVQLPFNTSYQPLPVTFRCSGDLREKHFFEEWQKLIYNETTNTLGWYEDFVGSAEVSQLNRNGKVLATYHLYEVWPGPINSIAVSHDSTDTISEIQVSLYYRNYRLVK